MPRQVIQARERGVSCRVHGGARHARRGASSDFWRTIERPASRSAQIEKVPMKMAVIDARQGLIALLDPVITKPAWTSVVFDHEGMAEAMKGSVRGLLAQSHLARGARFIVPAGTSVSAIPSIESILAPDACRYMPINADMNCFVLSA